MEDTALSLGKSVLSGALTYAKSAIAQEVALQLGVRPDQVFITNELEMMQAFLMAAHEDRDDSSVVKVWVKQVRDLAYNVEDTLQEISVRLDNQSKWKILRTMRDRHRVALQMKELRASVEEVSQRSLRYSLIKGSSSKDTMVTPTTPTAPLSGIKAAWGTRKQRSASADNEPSTEIVEEEHLYRIANPDIVGREKEKREIIKLISNEDSNEIQVISIWGMGGIGKTTVVTDILEDPLLTARFDKCACATVMRPYVLKDLVRNLVMQLGGDYSEISVVGLMGVQPIEVLRPLEYFTSQLVDIVKGNSCLIVIDDVSCATEWDIILPFLVEMQRKGRILVTTRDNNIAVHCSRKSRSVYMLKELEDLEAEELFTKKVFNYTKDLNLTYPELAEEGKLILRKCSGLPLAIVTIAGYLANRPKSVLEWSKLNEHLNAELVSNPELGSIRNSLISSYDGLPYLLKSCFLYMPLFPEDYKVGRGRLVRRWTAEDYPKEIQGKYREDIADDYFNDLISRSVILPCQTSLHSRKGVDSCHVHDVFRSIGLTIATEEKLIFTLEEGCSSSRVAMRHLVINSSWSGDKNEFKNMVDISHVRSLTVFGNFKSFYISDKMRLLRVLDMENATDVRDHHLKQVGKFRHLRYFSVKGCGWIRHLPDSLGNLTEMLTLDVRDTNVKMLPKGITKLQKLNNLYAGLNADDDPCACSDRLRSLMTGNMACCMVGMVALVAMSLYACMSCLNCIESDEPECCELFRYLFCDLFPASRMELDGYGVVMPKGLSKMKALNRLCAVDIGQDRKSVLDDIKELTRLRKLGVSGVSMENGNELFETVAALRRLESLSIISQQTSEGFADCLDGSFSSPENLQSLKLYGNLVKLPEWIKGLNNLVKLKLRSNKLDYTYALDLLTDLPSLRCLCLLSKHSAVNIDLTFKPLMFQRLVVLEMGFGGRLKTLKFCFLSAPKLSVIKFSGTPVSVQSVSGLSLLDNLKVVVVERCKDASVTFLKRELAGHPNRPVLKLI